MDLTDKIHYDILTGIYNRRFLEENLARCIKSISRSGGEISVFMMDVDYFKNYNDTYGHSEGDECLKAVAAVINGTLVRADDFVARCGGDIYWMNRFDKGCVMCVCDCTGHGTPGALLTMLVVPALETVVLPSNCDDTAGTIWRLDERLAEVFSVKEDGRGLDAYDIKDGCDLAVLFIANDGNITLSAGHTNVYVCDGKEVKRIRGQKLYVGEGKISGKDEIKAVHIPHNPDNKFYIASDGLSDQSGWEDDAPFGYRALGEIALANHDKPLSEITDIVWAAFEEHRGNTPRLDDFELVAFKP